MTKLLLLAENYQYLRVKIKLNVQKWLTGMYPSLPRSHHSLSGNPAWHGNYSESVEMRFVCKNQHLKSTNVSRDHSHANRALKTQRKPTSSAKTKQKQDPDSQS